MPPDMNTILGLGQDIPFEGKTYRLSDDLDFGVGASFERWLKSEAIKIGVEVAQDHPSEADHFRRLFVKESLDGTYRLDGEIARRAITGNPAASVQLLYLLLDDGKNKAGKDAPEVTPQLAKRMLKDRQVGPLVQAICLVALGLDPTTALVMAMGLVMTRAEISENQTKTASVAELKKEIMERNSKLSESSFESSLSFVLTYLDSVGAN